MEDYLKQREVDIYSSTSTITNVDVPFPTEKFANEIFGGFKNDVFYDYLNLFIIIFFIIFCIKIFAIFFEK